VVLFWELNTPRNVSFMQILMMICFGGVTSLALLEIVARLSGLGWLGALSPGITEEVAKLLTVIIVVRNAKFKYILNGIVFGAAVGAGFAAFETAGYSFYDGFLTRFMLTIVNNTDYLNKVIHAFHQDPNNLSILKGAAYTLSKPSYEWTFKTLELRSYLAPFGHIAWTAIAAGAFWRVKGGDPFKIRMLFDPAFVRAFLVPVALHTLWDTDFVEHQNWLIRDLMLLGLGVIAWYVAFLLVQQGLRQIKEAQVAQTKTEFSSTREILTTTGRFRATTIS
jgi:RsiW-degrading membrane proteinase PrsW (M82 family)